MKHLSIRGTVLFLLGGSALAQTPYESIVATPPMAAIRRAIPSSLGGGSARRIVRFDPDGDMLQDLAILWSNGDVTFGYAPEIMAVFIACPIAGATAITRIDAAFAPAGTGGDDGLLVADGAALGYLGFDRLLARTGTSTGLTVAPVIAGTAWQQVVGIEAFTIGGNCWVLGLGADQRTVHIGAWSAAGIIDCAVATAGADVKQLLAMDPASNGQLQIVARTVAGIEMWDGLGATICAPIAAPTSGGIGAMAAVQDGPVRCLAWMAQANSTWLLRLYCGPLLQQETQVTASEYMPDRFRPISLGSIAIDGSGTNALVLNQNSTPWQLVLSRDTGAQYLPACAFEFAGITYPVDTCPAILDDIDNDAANDCTTVLSDPRCVQIDTALPDAVRQALLNGDASDHPDLLPHACTMTQSTRSNAQPDDTIVLHLRVPEQYGSMPGLEVQVVAWPQYVGCPAGNCENGFDAAPIGDAVANVVFPLDSGGVMQSQPTLPVELPPEPNGEWTEHEQYYFMVRLIQRNGAEVVWSSPAQMVGFVANNGAAPQSGFLQSVSSSTGYGSVSVQGGNRNVGLIQKPDHIDPPSSVAKLPDPGDASPGIPGPEWQ